MLKFDSTTYDIEAEGTMFSIASEVLILICSLYQLNKKDDTAKGEAFKEFIKSKLNSDEIWKKSDEFWKKAEQKAIHEKMPD